MEAPAIATAKAGVEAAVVAQAGRQRDRSRAGRPEVRALREVSVQDLEVVAAAAAVL